MDYIYDVIDNTTAGGTPTSSSYTVTVAAVAVLIMATFLFYKYRRKKSRRRLFHHQPMVNDNEYQPDLPHRTITVLFSEKDGWVRNTLFPKLQKEPGITLLECTQPGKLQISHTAGQVRKSDKIIVILSYRFIQEGFGMFAIDNAVAQSCQGKVVDTKKVVIPLRIEKCDIPAELIGITRIDYFGADCNIDSMWSTLMSAIWEGNE